MKIGFPKWSPVNGRQDPGKKRIIILFVIIISAVFTCATVWQWIASAWLKSLVH